LKFKEILDSLGLSSFVKTSGKTGLHIYVPIIREFNYDAVRSVAGTVARFFLQKFPEKVTVDWTVEKRAGKVFIDFNQNVREKTLIAPYMCRATPGATISLPLQWIEVGKIYPTDFTIRSVPERVRMIGDIWGNMMDFRSDLSTLFKLEKD